MVYIGTLNPAHYTDAVNAVNSGKNVLVEKPGCLNAAEWKALSGLAKQKGVFLMEGWRHIDSKGSPQGSGRGSSPYPSLSRTSCLKKRSSGISSRSTQISPWHSTTVSVSRIGFAPLR